MRPSSGNGRACAAGSTGPRHPARARAPARGGGELGRARPSTRGRCSATTSCRSPSRWPSGRSGRGPPNEHDFVAASRVERDREEAVETERVARQARANRRLRVQLVVIGVALVVALVGGRRRRPPRRGRGRAARRHRPLPGRGVLGQPDADDPDRSILLALAAVDATREHGGEVLPEAIEALHKAVAESRAGAERPRCGRARGLEPRRPHVRDHRTGGLGDGRAS